MKITIKIGKPEEFARLKLCPALTGDLNLFDFVINISGNICPRIGTLDAVRRPYDLGTLVSDIIFESHSHPKKFVVDISSVSGGLFELLAIDRPMHDLGSTPAYKVERSPVGFLFDTLHGYESFMSEVVFYVTSDVYGLIISDELI